MHFHLSNLQHWTSYHCSSSKTRVCACVRTCVHARALVCGSSPGIHRFNMQSLSVLEVCIGMSVRVCARLRACVYFLHAVCVYVDMRVHAFIHAC